MNTTTTASRIHPLMAGAAISVTVLCLVGAASIAAVMAWRLAVRMPAGASEAEFGGNLPVFLHQPFADAMGESLLLGAAVILLAVGAAAFFLRPPAEHMDRTPR